MGSVCFPILYDHTNNQEKFQVPRISLNTAPRFSYVSHYQGYQIYTISKGTFKHEFGPIWKNEDIFLKLNDLPRHLVKMSQNSPINFSFVLLRIFILNPSNLQALYFQFLLQPVTVEKLQPSKPKSKNIQNGLKASKLAKGPHRTLHRNYI